MQASPSPLSPLHKSGVGLQDYIEIFWRRKWLVAMLTVLGLLGGYGACYLIPPVYRSSTLILVEPQKVPTAYVNPTVPGTVDDRLRTISQQIMSRTNLSKIIRDYGLYKAEASEPAQDDSLLKKIRNRVRQFLNQYGLNKQTSSRPPDLDEISEGVIGRMRKDIEVKVIGKQAFSVTYKGADPHTVMRVTNTLALLFIEENLKIRERQAEGTSEFLESQLVEAERELQKQERALREFQEQHRGALPAQLDTNLRTLDRLQQELNAVNTSIKDVEMALAEERKQALEERRLLQEMMRFATPLPTTNADAQSARAPHPKVAALKQELARLRATFNENYPDIVAIKRQIEELTQEGAQPQEVSTASGTPASSPGADAVRLATPVSPLPGAPPALTPPAVPRETSLVRGGRTDTTALAALPSGNATAERHLAGLRERRDRILAQMQKLEAYVNSTPANEEKLTELTRDHSISLKNYQSLLEKRLHAKISENLEKKQKGEQFRVVDPAYFPTKPSEPNPPLVVGIGGALGGGIGIGLVLLLHYFNPVLRKPEEIARAFGLPVLATIPRYNAHFSNHHFLVVLQEPESFIAEQYRILYTKINELSKGGSQKIFAITSALQNEGKTVTALNLAVVMAKNFGKRTLVLEGDFRRPSLPLYLKTELEEGLVDLLSSKADMHTTMVPVAHTLIPFADDNLTVLPAVRKTQNSSSLLSSQRLRSLFEILREQYDFVLIDAPPILPLSDMNIFEEVVDGILLVVRAESTPQAAVAKAIEELGAHKILGIVLNDVQRGLSSYYRYGYRYHYSYKPDQA